MRHLLTLPICQAHQVLHPCQPGAKGEARNQVKNWTAMGWMLLFGAFFAATLWYSAGGR